MYILTVLDITAMVNIFIWGKNQNQGWYE